MLLKKVYDKVPMSQHKKEIYKVYHYLPCPHTHFIYPLPINHKELLHVPLNDFDILDYNTVWKSEDNNLNFNNFNVYLRQHCIDKHDAICPYCIKTGNYKSNFKMIIPNKMIEFSILSFKYFLQKEIDPVNINKWKE